MSGAEDTGGWENRKYRRAALRAAGGASTDLAPGRMAAPAAFTDAEFYQRSFDPQEYLREFCSLSSVQGQPNTLLTQSLRSLFNMFALGEYPMPLPRVGQQQPAPFAGLRAAACVPNTARHLICI